MRRCLKLLVVQKSETTTQDVQNPGNNGINYLHLNWFSRREFLVAIIRAGNQEAEHGGEHIGPKRIFCIGEQRVVE